MDDEKENNITSWGELLRSWLFMMVGYLDVNNDKLDNCETRASRNCETCDLVIKIQLRSAKGHFEQRQTRARSQTLLYRLSPVADAAPNQAFSATVYSAHSSIFRRHRSSIPACQV